MAEDWCLESESGHLCDSVSNSRSSLEIRKLTSSISKSSANVEELKDDVPLISFIWSTKASTKRKGVGIKNIPKSTVSPKKLSNLNINEQTVVGHKRTGVFLLDDEDEMQDEVECSKNRPTDLLVEDFANPNECELIIA